MTKFTYKSRKIDKVFMMVYAGIGLLFLGFGIYGWTEGYLMVLMVMGFMVMLLAMLLTAAIFQLRIILQGSLLKVYCFVKLYETDVSTITKIRKGETMWSGLHKYGTTRHGLIMFASYRNDLYITPEDEGHFIQKIAELNPKVVFEEVQKS